MENSTDKKITVVLPVYNEVTQLDFTGPHQFLSMVPHINLVIASVGGEDITTQGLSFNKLANLDEIEECDVIIVPGGLGCIDAMENTSYMNSVKRLAASAKYITSVCSGSLILGAAGLITGRRAASHWAWIDMLTEFGATPDHARVVRDGNILTGGGVTAGMDFSLTLIAELFGPEVAMSIQLILEYSPEPPFNAGRPELAPSAITEAVTAQMKSFLGDGRKRVQKVAEQLVN